MAGDNGRNVSESALHNETMALTEVLLSSLTNSGNIGFNPQDPTQLQFPPQSAIIPPIESLNLGYENVSNTETVIPKELLSKPQNCLDNFATPACLVPGQEFCLEDESYPQFGMNDLMRNDSTLVSKYAEVVEQTSEDLVPFLTSKNDEDFDYAYFNPSTYDNTHWFGPDGYICPSKVIYGRPLRAMNAKGDWKYVLNDGDFFTQTLRLEMCTYPNTPCRLIAPCFRSHCLQKFSYHRLLAFDPCNPSKGLHVDMFRLPSACSCFAPAFHGMGKDFNPISLDEIDAP